MIHEAFVLSRCLHGLGFEKPALSAFYKPLQCISSLSHSANLDTLIVLGNSQGPRA
jgi:hypothetical protein